MTWHHSSNNAWLHSLLVHLGFIALLLLGFLLNLFQREPEQHVFELVMAAPSESAQPAPSPQQRPSPAPEPQVQLPDIPRSEPLPALPRVDTRPVPRPEPPPPTTPPPAPAPQPTQQAQPQPQPPQQISIDDFRRNRPVPDRVQTRPTQQNRPIDVPRIDTSDILRNLQSNVVNISASELQSLTVAQQSDLNAYHDQIRARLRAVFRPNAANLEATAQFTVLANGRVVNASIIRSSGDPVFDAAVLQAFRDMQSPGPPPGNRSYDFRIILRSSDGRR